MRSLFVEDDAEIRRMLSDHLASENYEIVCAADGIEASKKTADDTYSLILLDLMIPKLSGLEVLQQIRTLNTVPVIIMSTKDTDSDIAFGRGADDHITKPFSVTEMLARIKANIRRNTQYAAPDLNVKESDILRLLLENPKRVYTKEQIYSLIWNNAYMGDENAVNIHISRLRSKIEDNPRSPRYMLTVWGIGYRSEDGA